MKPLVAAAVILFTLAVGAQAQTPEIDADDQPHLAAVR